MKQQQKHVLEKIKIQQQKKRKKIMKRNKAKTELSKKE